MTAIIGSNGAGKSTRIITHRFTTARFVDVIHVMDQGRIVESGTHDKLLLQNNRYINPWRQQVQCQPAPSNDPRA